jgi:hypothetical protein
VPLLLKTPFNQIGGAHMLAMGQRQLQMGRAGWQIVAEGAHRRGVERTMVGQHAPGVGASRTASRKTLTSAWASSGTLARTLRILCTRAADAQALGPDLTHHPQQATRPVVGNGERCRQSTRTRSHRRSRPSSQIPIIGAQHAFPAPPLPPQRLEDRIEEDIELRERRQIARHGTLHTLAIGLL